MKTNKFIIIPDTIYQSSLNETEMMVFGFIYSMSQKNGYCYARNSVFEHELKMSKQKIQRAIKKLILLNFVTKEIKGSIRHLVPKMTVIKSNLIPKNIKNDTKRGIKNDTHNKITNNKKNNKLIEKSIHSSSLSSSNQKKVENLLIKCIEHLNKRYLNIPDYKIKASEYKHIGFLFELFKSYLNHYFDTIDLNTDEFYKYLYSFYLDLRKNIYKNKVHKKRKRHYPYRFKGMIYELTDFDFETSKYNNEDYLTFKQELDDNDNYDPNENSILNWLN